MHVPTVLKVEDAYVSQADVVIVGGGASATLMAFHVARRAESCGTRVSVSVIARNGLGPGLPYATAHPLHVLNVPAGRMSAIAGDAGHLVAWCRGRGMDVDGGDFVPRGVFGAYLKWLAEEASRRLDFRLVSTEACGLELRDQGVAVTCADGDVVRGRQCVLALGHGLPRIPAGIEASARGHAGYVNDPWGCVLERERLERGAILIGTGLTMMDCAISAAGICEGVRLLALSRRGLLPQAHRHQDLPPVTLPPPPVAYWPSDDRGLLRALRRYVNASRNRGYNWREAMTALRPVTAQLWQGMSERGKRRFLAKLAVYWDSHRHRAAPEVAARIEALRGAGTLGVEAGRIVRVRAAGDVLVVEYVRRGGEREREVRAGYVINCTGPETDLARAENPLMRQMLGAGLLRADELGLGIDTDELGQPLDARGTSLPRVWTIGPMRKAQLWESTAVPEIRVQAEELAKRLVGDGRA